MNRRLSVPSCLLAVLGVAGCSALSNAAGVPAAVTATEQQARSKAEALVDDTAAHIRPALSWQASTVGHTPDYSGVDGRYDGTMRVVVSRDAQVRLAKDRLPTLEAAIAGYWREQGFQLQIGHATDGNFAIDATKDQVHLLANSDAPWGITISADMGTVKGPKDVNSVDGTPIPVPTGPNGSPISPTPSVDPYWSH